MPKCKVHRETELICPRCIAAKGGKKTAANNPGKATEWGKTGGRGHKKPDAGRGHSSNGE